MPGAPTRPGGGRSRLRSRRSGGRLHGSAPGPSAPARTPASGRAAFLLPAVGRTLNSVERDSSLIPPLLAPEEGLNGRVDGLRRAGEGAGRDRIRQRPESSQGALTNPVQPPQQNPNEAVAEMVGGR